MVNQHISSHGLLVLKEAFDFGVKYFFYIQVLV